MFPEGRQFYLFCSVLYFYHLEQCLVHGICRINGCCLTPSHPRYTQVSPPLSSPHLPSSRPTVPLTFLTVFLSGGPACTPHGLPTVQLGGAAFNGLPCFPNQIFVAHPPFQNSNPRSSSSCPLVWQLNGTICSFSNPSWTFLNLCLYTQSPLFPISPSCFSLSTVRGAPDPPFSKPAPSHCLPSK